MSQIIDAGAQMDLRAKEFEAVLRRYFFADGLAELDIRRLYREAQTFAEDPRRWRGLSRELIEQNGFRRHGGLLWWEERRREGKTELDCDDATLALLWLATAKRGFSERVRPNCPEALCGWWHCTAWQHRRADWVSDGVTRSWVLAPDGSTQMIGFERLEHWTWRLVEARTPKIVFRHPTRRLGRSAHSVVDGYGTDAIEVVDSWGTTSVRLVRAEAQRRTSDQL